MTQPCPHCNGVRTFRVDEIRVRQCICVYLEKMRTHLGPEISGAPVIKSSPLYTLDGKVDLTTKNLFITSTWAGLLTHLKYALTGKGLGFYFTVVTDGRLKNVFLGNEALPVKSRSEDSMGFNSLPNLVGEDFDLVVIRLGFLGYPNRAASGILKESLMVRDSFRKATWLVEHPDHPFNTLHSYSLDVENYIDAHGFRRIELDSEGQEDAVENLPEDNNRTVREEPVPGMSIDIEPPFEEGSMSSSSSDDLMDDNLLGGNDRPKKKSKWRNR